MMDFTEERMVMDEIIVAIGKKVAKREANAIEEAERNWNRGEGYYDR